MKVIDVICTLVLLIGCIVVSIDNPNAGVGGFFALVALVYLTLGENSDG